MIYLGVVVAGGIIVFLLVNALYNNLVNLRNRVHQAWSQTDLQLKRRHELVAGLLKLAKEYMSQEEKVVGQMAEARNRAMSAEKVSERSKAEGALSSLVSKFFSAAEGYPRLRANENFLALQKEITSIEGKIAAARQNYNDQVLAYDTAVGQFPSSVVASIFVFNPESLFKLEDEGQRETPQLNVSSEKPVA